jgi:DNA-binding transcriptional LysR family regulator
MRLSLTQLSHAVAVAKSRNFHRAAEQLHLSQPGLSRSIRSLEEGLGIKLFDRRHAGIEATEFGKVLVQHAVSIIDLVSDLESEIALMKGADSGKVSVAAGPFPGELCVLPALGRLLAKKPHLAITVRQHEWRSATDSVRRREADFAIAEISYAEEFQDLTTRILGEHPIHFFCRDGHPLLAEKRVSIQQIFSGPVIGVPIPRRIQDVLDQDVQREAPDSADHIRRASVEIDMIGSGKQLVMQSDAIMAATFTMMEDLLAAGRVRVLPASVTDLRLRYGLIAPRHRSLSVAATALIEEVDVIESELRERESHLLRQYQPAT